MALANMIAELRGTVPGYSALLAKTHLNEAWLQIRNLRGWSFQLQNGGFSTPGLINQGGATVTFGDPTVTLNAAASAAVIANGSQYGSLLTQRQFRCGTSTIYNIVGANFDTPTAVALTLDRPWTDTILGNAIGYSIYQCYYTVPVQDFESWESVMDQTNVIYLNTTAGYAERQFVDTNDPQRQIFSNPGTLLPYQTDTRPNTSTPGWMMYELYPQPQARYNYSTWYLRLGSDLVNPSDTLPQPISEDMVKSLARVKAYEWAEANKDPANPRGSGADYRFLMGSALARYEKLLKETRILDRERVDMFKATMTRLSGIGPLATYNPSTGRVMSRNM